MWAMVNHVFCIRAVDEAAVFCNWCTSHGHMITMCFVILLVRLILVFVSTAAL